MEKQVLEKRKPFLGVCVGMQMLFETGHEHGTHEGLGWIQGEVKKITHAGSSLKIPHMGWNEAVFRPGAPLTQGLRAEGEPFYFVHSYRVVETDPSLVWCETDYAGRFVSGVRRGRVFATQFHPEKSQAKGLQLYRNFLTLSVR